jgi:uncharacterized protein YbjT (DUF2867 family)
MVARWNYESTGDREAVMFVIAGATGHTGKVAAEKLLFEKKPVRVILRNAETADAWKKRGAEVAILPLDDELALATALHGAAGAYLLLPPNMASTDARGDNARRTAGYVKAIEVSAVKHVVFLSSIGSQHDSGTGPILSTHDAEVALAKVNANVTILRAAYFMENWAASLYALGQGSFPSFLAADRAIPMVASADIGETAAELLLEGGRGHAVVELSGPREYSPKDIAGALSRITGKTVTVDQGPEAAIVAAFTGAGLNAHWARLYEEMIHGLNTGRVAFEGGKARGIRGTTDIETVMKRLVS